MWLMYAYPIVDIPRYTSCGGYSYTYVKLKFNGPLVLIRGLLSMKASGMCFFLPHGIINQLTNQSIGPSLNQSMSIHPFILHSQQGGTWKGWGG